MCSVTELGADERVVLVVVQKRSLDELSTRELVDDVLTAASERAGVPIVLDLSRVRFAPSVALGALVQLSKSLKLDGRRIALIGLQKRVQEAIGVTQLHTVLKIYETLEQAVRALSGDH